MRLSGPVLIIKTEAWRNALKRIRWTERQAPVARSPFTMCAKILGENLDLVTISEQGPNRGAKQALDGKKIGYQLLSVIGQHALRMKLHPFDGEFAVAQTHDDSRAITLGRPGTYLQFVWQGFFLDN